MAPIENEARDLSFKPAEGMQARHIHQVGGGNGCRVEPHNFAEEGGSSYLEVDSSCPEVDTEEEAHHTDQADTDLVVAHRTEAEERHIALGGAHRIALVGAHRIALVGAHRIALVGAHRIGRAERHMALVEHHLDRPCRKELSTRSSCLDKTTRQE